VHSSTESYLSDTDNNVLFENTTPINQNKKVKIKECRLGAIILRKWDSVNFSHLRTRSCEVKSDTVDRLLFLFGLKKELFVDQ